jgi:hypothetical protein
VTVDVQGEYVAGSFEDQARPVGAFQHFGEVGTDGRHERLLRLGVDAQIRMIPMG